MHISIIPICLALSGIATAQNQFSSPRGGVENEWSQTWFEGDEMDIRWYGEWKGSGAGADVVDLWVTWFQSPAFSQMILPNIQMGDDGTTSWKINVTNAIAKEDKRFVLRLKPHTSPPKYTDTLNQASGVGINIQPNGNSDSTSSSSSSSSTSSSATSTSASSTRITSTITSATKTTAPSALGGNTGKSKKKKTSIGPIVGGILGGLLLLILILLAVLMLLRMKKKKNNEEKEASESAVGEALMAPQYERQDVKYFHDAPLGVMAPVELADTHGTRPGQGFAHELPAASAGGGTEWRR